MVLLTLCNITMDFIFCMIFLIHGVQSLYNIWESWSFFCLKGLCGYQATFKNLGASFNDEEVIERWDQVNHLPLRVLKTKMSLLRQTKETLLVVENPLHAGEGGVPPGLICEG